jgi:hypothetical protein
MPFGRELIERAHEERKATLRLFINFRPGDRRRRSEIVECVCALSPERARRVFAALQVELLEERERDP